MCEVERVKKIEEEVEKKESGYGINKEDLINKRK